MPVVMLANERSERVSITTGTVVHVNVAGGDPLCLKCLVYFRPIMSL